MAADATVTIALIELASYLEQHFGRSVVDNIDTSKGEDEGTYGTARNSADRGDASSFFRVIRSRTRRVWRL
jgi:hypothetical protein